jgi:hypothetical protein
MISAIIAELPLISQLHPEILALGHAWLTGEPVVGYFALDTSAKGEQVWTKK